MDLRGRSITLGEDENAEQLREQLSAIVEQLQRQTQALEVIANAVTGGPPPHSTNGHMPEPD